MPRELSKPASYIPPPPSKAKRARPWDAAHKNITSYRGIDPQIAEQVRSLADGIGVPVGEVAQALLNYALDAVAAGQLKLNPRPRSGRFTLFGGNDD